MTCAELRAQLDEGPPLLGAPDWAAAVRHTWECAACRAELVAAVTLVERFRAALSALPAAPSLPTAWSRPPAARSARERLGRRARVLPAVFRLAADPLLLIPGWVPGIPPRGSGH